MSGAAFLPEGAAPFVLADPVRVIPAVMAGGAVSGALVMELGARISYPFGGAFAFREISAPLLFLAAVATGVLTAAALIVGLKSLRQESRTGSGFGAVRGGDGDEGGRW